MPLEASRGVAANKYLFDLFVSYEKSLNQTANLRLRKLEEAKIREEKRRIKLENEVKQN